MGEHPDCKNRKRLAFLAPTPGGSQFTATATTPGGARSRATAPCVPFRPLRSVLADIIGESPPHLSRSFRVPSSPTARDVGPVALPTAGTSWPGACVRPRMS